MKVTKSHNENRKSQSHTMTNGEAQSHIMTNRKGEQGAKQINVTNKNAQPKCFNTGTEQINIPNLEQKVRK